MHLDYALICAVISGVLIGTLVSLIGIRCDLQDIAEELRKRNAR